jgi:hypothetical protein
MPVAEPEALVHALSQDRGMVGMKYSIELRDGIFTLAAKLALDDIERFRIALGFCRDALATLEEAPRGSNIAELKPK